jgi:hypothetical protein
LIDGSLKNLLSGSSSPKEMVHVLEAVSAVASTEQQTSIQNSIWRTLNDTQLTAETRFSFAHELLRSGRLGLKEGVFDSVAFDATQATLAGSASDAAALVSLSMAKDCKPSLADLLFKLTISPRVI